MMKTKVQSNVIIKKLVNPLSELLSCTKVDHVGFSIKVYGVTVFLDFDIEYFEDESGKRYLQYIEVNQKGVKNALSWMGPDDMFSFFTLFKDYTQEIFDQMNRSTLSALNHTIVDYIKSYCIKKHIKGMH